MHRLNCDQPKAVKRATIALLTAMTLASCAPTLLHGRFAQTVVENEMTDLAVVEDATGGSDSSVTIHPDSAPRRVAKGAVGLEPWPPEHASRTPGSESRRDQSAVPTRTGGRCPPPRRGGWRLAALRADPQAHRPGKRRLDCRPHSPGSRVGRQVHRHELPGGCCHFLGRHDADRVPVRTARQTDRAPLPGQPGLHGSKEARFVSSVLPITQPCRTLSSRLSGVSFGPHVNQCRTMCLMTSTDWALKSLSAGKDSDGLVLAALNA